MKYLDSIKNFQAKKFFTLKRVIFFSFYIIFIISLFYILYLQIRNGYAKESWQISEFLINYQGGFVRRGLIGEILLNLYKYCNIDPYLAILSLSLFSYVTLLFFFMYSFLKKGFPIILLPFTFFLGGPILHNMWVRKDIIITLFFIMALYFSIKKSNIYIILTNLCLMIAILIHEGVAFFGLPIILLVFINNNFYNAKFSLKKSFLFSIFKLSPSIIILLMCIYFNGSLAVETMIRQSWEIVKFPLQSTMGMGWGPWEIVKFPLTTSANSTINAISALSWSVKDTLLFFTGLKMFDGGIYAPIAWSLIILLIYHFLANTNKIKILIFKTNENFNKTSFSNILIFQLLMLMPLLIIGFDYGRWIFFWVSSSFAILVLIPPERLTIIFPRFISCISPRINAFLDSIIVVSKDLIYVIPFFIGFTHFSWNLDWYFESIPIIIIFRSISKFIYLIGMLFKDWIH